MAAIESNRNENDENTNVTLKKPKSLHWIGLVLLPNLNSIHGLIHVFPTFPLYGLVVLHVLD